MAGRAGAVRLSRGNARQANARTLGAPDRSIAIVNGGGRAFEGLTGRDHRDRGEEGEHDTFLHAANRASKRAWYAAAPPNSPASPPDGPSTMAKAVRSIPSASPLSCSGSAARPLAICRPPNTGSIWGKDRAGIGRKAHAGRWISLLIGKRTISLRYQ